MLFRFRNIGKIAEADIEINGLTVLGGHNDTGKSTIGKTLYSVIKAINNSETEYNNMKKEQIKKLISQFRVNIRKLTGFSIIFSREENVNIINLSDEREIIESLKNSFEKVKTFLVKRNRDSIISEIEKIFQQAIDNILNLFQSNMEDIVKYQNAFTRANKFLFKGEFVNKKSIELPAEISCSDSENEILKIIVKGDSITDFLLQGDFTFEDVTFIESPIILNQFNFIKTVRPDSMLISNIFGSYNFDLSRKIDYLAIDVSDAIYDSHAIGLISYISNIIDGKLYYDEEGKDFIFERDQNISIKSINIASGIKAFGIIQLLIISGAVNPNTLLIIDEPEVHLHPEWQLKYAELIAKLVDSGVYVLISSHSPYMIEALKVYSDKLKLDKITRFYVGNAHEKGTVFQDVTEDMEPLFHQLAFPMQKLTFEA